MLLTLLLLEIPRQVTDIRLIVVVVFSSLGTKCFPDPQ